MINRGTKRASKARVKREFKCQREQNSPPPKKKFQVLCAF